MSLKSREKSMRRQDNIFAKQKAAVAVAKKWTADYLYAALLFTALTVWVYILAKKSPEDMWKFWCAMPILAALILGLLIGFWRRFCFLHTMEQVPFSSTEKREFVCTRVRMVICSSSRFVSEIVGIVFAAQDGKKYRYILPQSELTNSEILRRWKKQYVGQKLQCTCYSGTANIESVVLLGREGVG